MFWTIKTTLPMIIGVFFYFLIIKNYEKLNKFYIANYKFLVGLSLLFFSLEYWILGPYSFLAMVDEADHGLSRILHDMNFIGGKFLHNILGGSDYYASQLHGGQYISFEKLMFRIFPSWISISFHKVLLFLLNFVGLRLILNNYQNSNNFGIFAISLFAIVFNPYATTNTLQHGLGYALVPLSIYFFVFRINLKNYLLYCFLFSLLIATSISLTHSFLPIIYGIIIFGIFYCNGNYIKFLFSICILLILVLLNWSEVIYGFAEFSQITDRGNFVDESSFILGGTLGILPNIFFKTNLCFINCEIQYSPFVALILLSLFLSIIYFSKENLKLILIIFFTLYLPVILKYLNFLGISFFQTINFTNIGLFLIVPVSIMLTRLELNKLTKNIFSLVFCLAIIINLYNKIEASKQILFNGGQNRITGVENLKIENWKDKKNARVITTMPYHYFHPNFLWIYGHETLDGYINLIPTAYIDFWRYGIFYKKDKDKKYYRNGDLYINYTLKNNPFSDHQISLKKSERNLEETVDTNILKLLNTGYIISYVSLNGKNIKKISGPKVELFSVSSGERKKNYYLDTSKELVRNLIKTPDIFIYEINDFSEKFFFPSKIMNFGKKKTVKQKMQFMSKNYQKNIVFVDDNLDKYSSANGNVKKINKIKNGYKIEAEVNTNGLVVFNQIYLPYWKLYVNGKKTNIIKVNHNLMGFLVNEGDKLIEFKYERELLREKIKRILL